jgi:hypothetical protein
MGKICDLIANKHTTFTEDDREWLKASTDGQLDSLVPVNIPEPVDNVTVLTKMTDEELKAECKRRGITGNAEGENKMMTWDEIVANAPADFKAKLDFVEKQMVANREGWVARIKANKANKLTDEVIKTMSDAALQLIADSLAPVVNYDGGQGFQTVNAGDEEEGLALPDHTKK